MKPRKPIYNGGNSVFLGYKVIEKKIVIEEEDAAIVRDIFSKYIEGWKSYDIVRYNSTKE